MSDSVFLDPQIRGEGRDAGERGVPGLQDEIPQWGSDIQSSASAFVSRASSVLLSSS